MDYKLNQWQSAPVVEGPVVLVILDGFGIGKEDDGDCVHLTQPPRLNQLWKEASSKKLYAPIKAHGTAVGLPGDDDMGNSEVGHNAMGSGQIVDQGAKLVNASLASGALYETENWKNVISKAKTGKTVHFLGLLSDGTVHSHISHLLQLSTAMAKAGVPKVRYHLLTDGRDVSSTSALIYVAMLEKTLAEINSQGLDYQIASGGGRMYLTMDRYNADWDMVNRGYDAMVHGTIDTNIVPFIGKNGYTGYYSTMEEAVLAARKAFPEMDDQAYPPWVLVDAEGKPKGKVADGDVLINFNYRGDRALEISQAIEDKNFTRFDRKEHPNIDYYGMLIYDADAGIPKKSLFPNPNIRNTLSEFMVKNGVSMYACSETQKFGHVTYFWNGNRQGYLDPNLEVYEEVPSDSLTGLLEKPAMKAREITDNLVKALNSKKFRFLRINIANGDMVGHTGHIPATVETIRVIDECIVRILEEVRKHNGVTIVTADHGNCEEMLDAKGKPKTSHTCNLVPFAIDFGEKEAPVEIDVRDVDTPGLSNLASTVCNLLNFEAPSVFRPSLIQKKQMQ
eukprot:GEMP01009260.1.p1 GENE.GEMP01009260.1~~GEMP01009260.1.p1  ORF type:complete len:563 (+),score=132.93 GEMP01009260.1:1090-2778(+)